MKEMQCGAIPYSVLPKEILTVNGIDVSTFVEKSSNANIDWETVESFGDEWGKFDEFSPEEIQQIGDDYFDIVTDEMLNETMVALDVGCGTGRWSKYVARRAGFVEAIDPSEAVYSAAQLLKTVPNVRISQAEVGGLPFPDSCFDFVFSLGVLHHIPDTPQAMKDAVKKLKPKGFFLVYLYYDLENRGLVFRMIFRLSALLRSVVNKLPRRMKALVCDIIAFAIYMPFIGLAKLVRFLAPRKSWYKNVPLSYYSDMTINVIRNDALDRFGTPLEQRFARGQVTHMLEECGLENIVFSEKEPYWHAIGQKK